MSKILGLVYTGVEKVVIGSVYARVKRLDIRSFYTRVKMVEIGLRFATGPEGRDGNKCNYPVMATSFFTDGTYLSVADVIDVFQALHQYGRF